MMASPMSGDIPEKEDPPPLNKLSIRPDRDCISNGVLLRAKIFGEDWMAVPNDEYRSKIHRQEGIFAARFSLERVHGGPRLVG